MNDLYALDYSLNFLNESKMIDPISIMLEGIDRELYYFNSIINPFNIVLENENSSLKEKIAEKFKKFIEILKTLIKSIKEKFLQFITKMKKKIIESKASIAEIITKDVQCHYYDIDNNKLENLISNSKKIMDDIDNIDIDDIEFELDEVKYYNSTYCTAKDFLNKYNKSMIYIENKYKELENNIGTINNIINSKYKQLNLLYSTDINKYGFAKALFGDTNKMQDTINKYRIIINALKTTYEVLGYVISNNTKEYVKLVKKSKAPLDSKSLISMIDEIEKKDEDF